MKRTSMAAMLEVGTSMVILGSSVLVSKFITEEFPTAIASVLRLSQSALMQYLLMMFFRQKFVRLKPGEWFILFLQAFLGVFLYSFFFLEGLRRTTAFESSVILSLIPAAGALIARLVFGEKFTVRKKLGIVFTIAGTILIQVSSSQKVASGQHWLGNLMILATAVCQAIFITFGKLVSSEISVMQIGGTVSLMGALLFCPFALGELPHFQAATVSAHGWLWMVYIGVFCTGLAVMMMNQGNKRLNPSAVSALSALNPASAIVISCIADHERLTGVRIVGMLLIGMGILAVLYCRGERARGRKRDG